MSKDYFVGLHGAKVNSGDFLIRERASNLLTNLRPDRELVTLPSWEPLDDKLDLINNSKGVVIMGGPAISEHIYPHGFPLVKNLDQIKVPVHLLGVGSYIFPLSRISTYQFSEESLSFFKKCKSISTRDVVTKEVLERNGIKGAVVTGCPAMFDLPFLSGEKNYPNELKTILFSTPQRRDLQKQSLTTAILLQERFPKAKITICFNRGFSKNKYAKSRETDYLSDSNDAFKAHGFETIDLSKDIEKMKDIEKYDIHVGYRLHSHILFLSQNKVSYLISEDSRGYGNCDFLGMPIFAGHVPSFYDSINPFKHDGLFMRAYYNALPFTKLNDQLPQNLVSRISLDFEQNFHSLIGVKEKINSSYSTMSQFIKSFG